MAACTSAVAALSLLVAGAACAGLPAPNDLNADAALAAQRGKPVLILFSLPDCSFCEVVRRNYLAPLARDGAQQERPVVREVGLTGSDPFLGFDKQRTSGGALAARYKVRFAPTVIVLDADGKLLAPPLVGGDVSGMYGAYLDGALAQAQRTLARSAQ